MTSPQPVLTGHDATIERPGDSPAMNLFAPVQVRRSARRDHPDGYIVGLRVTVATEATAVDLAATIATSLQHVTVLDPAETHVAREADPARRVRVFCGLGLPDDQRCYLPVAHAGPCGCSGDEASPQ